MTNSSLPELTSENVQIENPEMYGEGRERLYGRLQQEAPVFHYKPLDVFVLSRHEDVRFAARTPEVFSSGHGLNLSQLRLTEPEKDAYSGFYGAGEQLVFADPPRHRELRAVISRSFAPGRTKNVEAYVATEAERLVPDLPVGEPVDAVGRLAAVLPVRTIEYFLGLPPGQDDRVRVWSDALEQVKLVRGAEAIQGLVGVFATMDDFIREQIEERRSSPGEDFISGLLTAQLDGSPVPDETLLTYCKTLIAGGSDVTRGLLSGMIHALAERPDAWASLRAAPDLVDGAVEESLRWVTPARGFLRTALEDTEIRGVPIQAGQRVYLLFDAANRDPEVFPDPWTFDVERPEAKKHLSFGFGVHACVASHLARTQARSLLAALLRRFSTLEISGEPERIHQVLRNGFHSVPVIFST
ncbi:cytochrome P450 [Arthrobacter sp. NPDC058127]|uniref:cytochrome P450 n=1 Tax=Arthrobacter sp. NPDC058127 TaxID=3346351 RepID=UPI0036EE56A8